MHKRMLQEKEIRELIEPLLHTPFVFLETALIDKNNHTSYLFSRFDDVITYAGTEPAEAVFDRIEEKKRQGWWLSGYFCYELGYCLEPQLGLPENSQRPLLWLGASRKPVIISHSKLPPVYAGPDVSVRHHRRGTYSVTNQQQQVTAADYNAALQRIKKSLEQGLTYQLNYTFKNTFDFSGNPLDLYLDLRRAQPTSYLAFISTGDTYIISLSPELFFRVDGRTICSKPMKGTTARGVSIQEDSEQVGCMRMSKKIHAENLMIVDMLRNDIGKLCDDVRTPELYTIETYRTLHQMTSTIEGTLRAEHSFSDIFRALFPCASVTGAPKIKTMELIRDLEQGPRGVYTGAIGYVSPERAACFNVSIRTVCINDRRGEFGVGGGILYESVDREEYDEAVLKTRFFTQKFPDFACLESLLWEAGKGYYLLELHMRRLVRSCGYFCIPISGDDIRDALRRQGEAIAYSKAKVRVRVDLDGAFAVSAEEVQSVPAPVRVGISRKPVDTGNRFLYHKTTFRDGYDAARADAEKQGLFDILFFNERGQMTEGTVTNLFVRKQDFLYTPPVTCGLLPGVLREHLLETGQAKEQVITEEDVLKADSVYIGNSVRGLLKAVICCDSM